MNSMFTAPPVSDGEPQPSEKRLGSSSSFDPSTFSKDDQTTHCSFVSPVICIFCKKQRKDIENKFDGRRIREHLRQCQHDIDKILVAAKLKHDEQLLSQLHDKYLVAAGLKCHHSCKRKYINSSRLKKSRSININNEIKHSVANDIFKNDICIFCKKQRKDIKKFDGRRNRECLQQCQHNIDKILDAAKMNYDEELLSQLQDKDPIAVGVKYHHSCKLKYINSSRLKKNRSVNLNNETKHSVAYDIFKKDIINKKIIKGKHGLRMSRLAELYRIIIQSVEEREIGRNTQHLKQKLLRDFPQLTFLKLRHRNRSEVVFCKSTVPNLMKTSKTDSADDPDGDVDDDTQGHEATGGMTQTAPPELLLDGYEVYEDDNNNTRNSIKDEDITTAPESLPSNKNIDLSSVSNSPKLFGDTIGSVDMPSTSVISKTVNEGEKLDKVQKSVIQSWLETKGREEMKDLLEQFIEKNEMVLSNNENLLMKPNSRNSRNEEGNSQESSSKSEENKLKTIKAQLDEVSKSVPEVKKPKNEIFPAIDDEALFSVAPGTTAKITKVSEKNDNPVSFTGHNIGGTILRPKSPTRNCRLLDKDRKHFTSALLELNVKDKAAAKVINVQKHESVCAVGAPVLFCSKSGVFVSNIDMTYFWCNFCPYKTEVKAELMEHVILHRFHCHHCNYQSFSRADVIQHSTDSHQEFQETSNTLKFCTLLPDFLQVNLIQSQSKDESGAKYSKDHDSYLVSVDGDNLNTKTTKFVPENGESNSQPVSDSLEASTSGQKNSDADKGGYKFRKRRQRDSMEISDDSDDDNDSNSSKKKKSDKSKKGDAESDSSSDSEPIKNLMEIYECNSCEFKTKEMQKVREHVFRIHPGGKFYCIDRRIKRNKAKRYIFFCCKNKCPFQSTDPVTYIQHVDRCTPLPVVTANSKKTTRPTGLQMTVQFGKKCLRKLSKNDVKKGSKKPTKVEDDYGCHYCKFETDSLIAVKSHLASSHSKNSFVVRDLKAVDSLMSFLYLCKFCAWYSRDYSKLKNHMDREHRIPDKKLMISSNSAEAFQMSEDQGIKVVTEKATDDTDDLSYRCYRCEFCTANLDKIKLHLTTVHPKCNLTAFSCKNGSLRTVHFCPQAECLFTSPHRNEMERHKIISHNVEDLTEAGKKASVCYAQAYKCLACNNTIATALEDMKMHYLQMHPNESMVIRDCVAFDLQKPSQLYLCDFQDCIYHDLNYKNFLFHNVAHEGGIVYECANCNDWVSKFREDYSSHTYSLPELEHHLMESTVEMDRTGSITRKVGDVVIKFEEP